MTTRTARRNSTRRTETHSHEITPDDVKAQLEKFLQKKNEFVEKFILVTRYEEFGTGQEMYNAFKKSQLYKKIYKFIKKYIKQEKKKLNKVKKDLRQEIKKNILENNDYSISKKKRKLYKLIGDYEEIIDQIRTEMEAPKSLIFDLYTFEYYYHKSNKNNLSSNELTKIKKNIADLQLLLEIEEDTETETENKDELSKQLYHKYELLNKVTVDYAFVDLLKKGFEYPIVIKKRMYSSLNDYVNESIISLESTRSPTSMVGKKKTKKHQNRRKILKSKKKKN